MRTIFPLALCVASLFQPAHALDAAPEAPVRAVSAASSVREAERQRAEAVTARNIDVLRRLISGDYYHVESNGRVRTKTEFLQALARDDFRLRRYGLDDMEVNVMDDGGTAIVTGTYRATMQGLPGGQPTRGRYVRVWTRHPDGWRNALHQSTEIRPANTPAAGAAAQTPP